MLVYPVTSADKNVSQMYILNILCNVIVTYYKTSCNHVTSTFMNNSPSNVNVASLAGVATGHPRRLQTSEETGEPSQEPIQGHTTG